MGERSWGKVMRDERRKKRRRKSLYRLKTALLSPIGIVGFACRKGRDRILFVPVVTPLRLACVQERVGEVSLAGIFALPPQPSANFEFSGSVFFGLGWGRGRRGRRSDTLLGRFQLSGERKRSIRRSRKGARERGRGGGALHPPEGQLLPLQSPLTPPPSSDGGGGGCS